MTKSNTYQKTDGSTVTVSEQDYKNIQGLSDEEIEHRAESDADALPLSDDELDKLKPVNPRRKKSWIKYLGNMTASCNAPRYKRYR